LVGLRHLFRHPSTLASGLCLKLNCLAPPCPLAPEGIFDQDANILPLRLCRIQVNMTGVNRTRVLLLFQTLASWVHLRLRYHRFPLHRHTPFGIPDRNIQHSLKPNFHNPGYLRIQFISILSWHICRSLDLPGGHPPDSSPRSWRGPAEASDGPHQVPT
jgi:hypothetical protein